MTTPAEQTTYRGTRSCDTHDERLSVCGSPAMSWSAIMGYLCKSHTIPALLAGMQPKLLPEQPPSLEAMRDE